MSTLTTEQSNNHVRLLVGIVQDVIQKYVDENLQDCVLGDKVNIECVTHDVCLGLVLAASYQVDENFDINGFMKAVIGNIMDTFVRIHGKEILKELCPCEDCAPITSNAPGSCSLQ